MAMQICRQCEQQQYSGVRVRQDGAEPSEPTRGGVRMHDI